MIKVLECEQSCYSCKYFSEFKEPREWGDGAVIYGYCFKSGDKNYSGNMSKGYAVFVPESGACKDYKRMRKAGDESGE